MFLQCSGESSENHKKSSSLPRKRKKIGKCPPIQNNIKTTPTFPSVVGDLTASDSSKPLNIGGGLLNRVPFGVKGEATMSSLFFSSLDLIFAISSSKRLCRSCISVFLCYSFVLQTTLTISRSIAMCS